MRIFLLLLFAGLELLYPSGLRAQAGEAVQDTDRKVRSFLDRMQGKWQDLNVPAGDGQILFDIIVKNGYTRALEIGTSTGHSTVWIAWALSKTGGKLITIEIDEARYRQAIANLREAGLEAYVDARLADAHNLVPELTGPFDFAFSDADKSWYVNYFQSVASKLVSGGCFVAHNVRPEGMGGKRATREYLAYVSAQKEFITSVDNSGGGLAISYKE